MIDADADRVPVYLLWHLKPNGNQFTNFATFDINGPVREVLIDTKYQFFYFIYLQKIFVCFTHNSFVHKRDLCNYSDNIAKTLPSLKINFSKIIILLLTAILEVLEL